MNPRKRAFQCDCSGNKSEKLGHRSYIVYKDCIFKDEKLQANKYINK